MKRIVLGVLLLCAGGLAAIASGQSAGQLSDDGSAGRERPDDKDKKSDDMKQMGMKHMHKWMKERGMKDDAMSMMDMQSDALGMMHMKFQQMHGKIPVFGAEVIVHMRPDGSMFGMTDNCAPGGMQIEKKTEISKKEALELAIRHYGCGDCFTKKPKLDKWVIRHGEEDRLVYRVQFFREDGTHETAMPVIFIDAHDGSDVMAYDNLQTVTGTGVSLYSGTVSVETLLSRRDLLHGGRGPEAGHLQLQQHDRQRSASQRREQRLGHERRSGPRSMRISAPPRPSTTSRARTAGTASTAAGGPALADVGQRRDRLVSSRVHYSNSYNNAFWNGQYMTYGDGDGVELLAAGDASTSSATRCTHGVTERTARLVVLRRVRRAQRVHVRRVRRAGRALHARARAPTPGRSARRSTRPARSATPCATWTTPTARPTAASPRTTTRTITASATPAAADNGGVHINSGIAQQGLLSRWRRAARTTWAAR